jgi:hypothetical protein
MAMVEGPLTTRPFVCYHPHLHPRIINKFIIGFEGFRARLDISIQTNPLAGGWQKAALRMRSVESVWR